MRHAWIALVALVGCSTDPLPSPDVALSVGQEKAAWVAMPPATHIQVNLVQLTDGTPTLLADVPAPAPAVIDDTKPLTIVPFPEEHFAGSQVASFEATALDANEAPVLRGHSIYYSMTSVYAVRIPIFIGKVGGFSRPLSTLRNPHVRPLVTSVYELLVAAGGDAVAGQDPAIPEFFDAAVWQTSAAQPPLPLAPKSMAAIGTKLVMIDGTGGTSLDLSSDETKKIDTSTLSLDFTKVAGGDTLEMPGRRFIVGATRQEGAPTDKILVLDDKLVPSVLTLSTPRLGAAASFVGTTLVVAGGSATGAGVEVLRQGDTAFVPLPYPPDATAGAGLAPLDEKTALVVGGQDAAAPAPAAPMRTFDITCAATCTPTAVGTLPIPLVRTKVFAMRPSQVIVVGENDEAMFTGVDHVFSIDPTTPAPFAPTEITLPAERARAKATPALMPNAQLGLVGGTLLDSAQTSATSIEIFIP
jgi:hypothetical protein